MWDKSTKELYNTRISRTLLCIARPHHRMIYCKLFPTTSSWMTADPPRCISYCRLQLATKRTSTSYRLQKQKGFFSVSVSERYLNAQVGPLFSVCCTWNERFTPPGRASIEILDRFQAFKVPASCSLTQPSLVHQAARHFQVVAPNIF